MKNIIIAFVLTCLFLPFFVLAAPVAEQTGTLTAGGLSNEVTPVCGDGVISTGEVCDGSNLTGQTCESRGYDSGTLACSADCTAFDESGCESAAPPGPGGGGGGLLIEKKVEEQTSVIDSLAAGETGKLSYTEPELGIYRIELITSKNVTDVKVTVKKLDARPSDIPDPLVTGELSYKYINISKTGLEDADIEDVKIKFKVAKKWIDKNGIDFTTIALSRYYNSVWTKLPTKILTKNDYIYYEAALTGLSIFVITGKTTLECPPCPEPTAWSECIENQQTRTNYRCGAETGWVCEEYTENRSCITPKEAALSAILTAKQEINIAVSEGKNTTEAQNLLQQASDAYDVDDWVLAKELAEQATKAAKEAQVILAPKVFPLFEIFVMLIIAAIAVISIPFYLYKIRVVPVQLEKVLKDPKFFAGKRVALRGWLKQEKISKKSGLTWYTLREPPNLILAYSKKSGYIGEYKIIGEVNIAAENIYLNILSFKRI